MLTSAISDRSARIGIVGLGYVGLPLAGAFHDAGFRVLGFDTDPDKIAQLSRGETYLKHLGEDFAQKVSASGRFSATTDLARLAEADAILICVPTPLGVHREPDLSYVERTSKAIAATLRAGQLVVLESTSFPGTTRDMVLPILESVAGARGLKLGQPGGFFLAFSPEREDPGRIDHSVRTIPKLVGGVDPASGKLAAALYRAAVDVVIETSSAEVAEAAKILENTFRAVNIALVNELKVLLDAMEINIWEVIGAAATKPFGFMPFFPGPGLGGHCIPIDPYYLSWKARELGQPARFIELAGEINHAMPAYVIARTVRALNQRGKPMNGARILVLGLAYKPDIDDVRESPSLELIALLREQGAIVEYNDPHVARTHRMRRYDLDMHSVELTPERLAASDCVLVATAHAAYDWGMIARYAPLIVDTRNALAGIRGARTNIVRA